MTATQALRQGEHRGLRVEHVDPCRSHRCRRGLAWREPRDIGDQTRSIETATLMFVQIDATGDLFQSLDARPMFAK